MSIKFPNQHGNEKNIIFNVRIQAPKKTTHSKMTD